MEKKLKQMLLSEVFPANQLVSQENKKEKMTIDSYSQKCLESLKRLNPDGLLVKMCKTLLTSQMEQSSEKLLKGWKPKISKSNVLVFQLVHKVLGTKEKESGLLPTPTTDSVSERTKKYKQGGTPLTMAVRQMYPTPNATNINTPQPTRVEQVSSGGFILRKKNKPHMTYGARLQDVMHHLDKTPGGTLNPEFVEFLMGYPKGWTDLEKTESKHLETQSFPKSQEKSEKQLSKQKMYRTPTSMDTNEDSMIYAAKILKGKVNRNSNQRVQITLSTDVAMEYLKNNPELIDQFDKPFMYRPNLPKKLEFINYLKSQTTIKELVNNTDIPKTKIEHWFRKDNCFSYPTIEDWNKIKSLLKEIKFDEELTYEVEKDWKEIE
jgi:paraquat-inducible protein B